MTALTSFLLNPIWENQSSGNTQFIATNGVTQHATSLKEIRCSGDHHMKSILSALAIACVVNAASFSSADAGLFCHARTTCCEPAPVCCAPAPVCCPQQMPCCAPEPVCCPDPCIIPRRGLLRRLLHCSEPCCPPAVADPCCAPAPCYTPAPAPCCAPVAPCCGSANYGPAYGYGIATNRPHWF